MHLPVNNEWRFDPHKYIIEIEVSGRDWVHIAEVVFSDTDISELQPTHTEPILNPTCALLRFITTSSQMTEPDTTPNRLSSYSTLCRANKPLQTTSSTNYQPHLGYHGCI